jgi:NTP pyrophosphatase (non-canonical NTP hydrolase)
MDTSNKKNDRHNLDPDTLQDLQVCLYDWQNYNFGSDQDNELTMLGIFEEAGELCHAQLKLEQSIRGSKEHHENEMADAIGDMMIYTMNYLSGRSEPLASFSPRHDVKPAGDEGFMQVRQSVKSVYKLAAKIEDSPSVLNGVHKVVYQLVYLCALKGWDLEGIVRNTWKNVGMRDWKKYPETGLATDMEKPENPAPALAQGPSADGGQSAAMPPAAQQ